MCDQWAENSQMSEGRPHLPVLLENVLRMLKDFGSGALTGWCRRDGANRMAAESHCSDITKTHFQ